MSNAASLRESCCFLFLLDILDILVKLFTLLPLLPLLFVILDNVNLDNKDLDGLLMAFNTARCLSLRLLMDAIAAAAAAMTLSSSCRVGSVAAS